MELIWKRGQPCQMVTNQLKELREKAGLTLEELSEESGYSVSFLSRLQSGDRTLSMKHVAVLSKVLGVDPVQLIAPSSNAGELADRVFIETRQPGLAESPTEFVQAPTRLSVKGEVRAGAWLEVDEQWSHDETTIPVGPDPRYQVQQYALKVVGDSMNKVFPEGQFVVCASLIEMGREPAQGDLVIVERHRGGLIEVTVKRFDASNGEAVLRPESTNDSYKPIKMSDQTQDTEIYITALVVGRYEPF